MGGWFRGRVDDAGGGGGMGVRLGAVLVWRAVWAAVGDDGE